MADMHFYNLYNKRQRKVKSQVIEFVSGKLFISRKLFVSGKLLNSFQSQ